MAFRFGSVLGAMPIVLATGALACGPVPSIDGPFAVEPGGVLRSASGVRYRLATLVRIEGELPAPPAETRLAVLGPIDRHGRVPALAVGPERTLEEGLLARGLARLSLAVVLPDPCLAALSRAEAEAIGARIGRWQAPGEVIPADDAAALRKADGRTVTLAGRVRSVREGRTVMFVNFGPPGSDALTVTIDRRHIDRFRSAGLEPASFRGQQLVVRGTLTVRRGPQVAVTHPWALSVVARRATSGP